MLRLLQLAVSEFSCRWLFLADSRLPRKKYNVLFENLAELPLREKISNKQLDWPASARTDETVSWTFFEIKKKEQELEVSANNRGGPSPVSVK